MADDYYSRVTEAATDADSRRLLHWIPAIIFAYVFLLSPLIVQAMAPSESTNVNVAGAQSNPANQLFWIGMLALTLIAVRRDFGAAFRLLRDPVVVLVVAYLAEQLLSACLCRRLDRSFGHASLQQLKNQLGDPRHPP